MEYVDLSNDVISVDKIGGHWRVLWNGRIIKTFAIDDGGTKAMGYSLALIDNRLRQPTTEE